MILFEEEKSKLLLGGMPYLRPLYIKGVLSMYEILSISWKESLIDLKNKFENIKSNKEEKNSKSNIKDNELAELNNKMFLIFSFMKYFYQMINNGKLKKYDGLDFIYTKLNSFFTLCRKIICYKILDINLEEFNQTKIILKLIIHVKLFLIFCEYDTYKSKEDFIQDLLCIFNPEELFYKNNKNNSNEENIINNNLGKNEENLNNCSNKEKEELVLQNLIKEIKNHNINVDYIHLYTEKIYNSLNEKYKNFINDDKFTFLRILYENYFELKSNEEEKEDSEEENDIKNNNKEQSTNKKKKRRKKNKKKKNKNKNNAEENNIKIDDKEEQNDIKNEIKNDNKEKPKDEGNEIKNDKIAKINEKITMIKTIQSIAKMTNKLINNMSFTEKIEQKNKINIENQKYIPQNKSEFDEIKKKFLEPLIPYIQQYQKIYGNKKMSILSLLQCAFIVYKEKYRKEKEKLLEEINNLKKAMNHMFIQIQLMGGGREIFRKTLYYLILIYIPEEQNNPSFFGKVQKLINFFQNKVNYDLNLIKNMTNGNNIDDNKLPCENINLIINRLHKNNQYVLFIKSIFFMYNYFNFIAYSNKNEKLQNKNNETIQDNENSLITKINTKNIKNNLPLIKDYFIEEEEGKNSKSKINNKREIIYPSFNFQDCYSSYANFLDEIVSNEKTQIIMDQVIQKIEEENKLNNGSKFEIKDLFVEKEGKKVFNITGFDVGIIIHEIKNLKYKDETLENLVNSKTFEINQIEV